MQMVPRLIDEIRAMPDSPARKSCVTALMLIDALRDKNLRRDVMVSVVAALISHDEAQQIERMTDWRERGDRT